MKKIVILLAAFCLLVAAGFAVYQFRPEKRYANHVAKARMYTKEANYTSALKEYEKAYAGRGGFTPYSSIETLKLTNILNLQKGDAKTAVENSKRFVERYPTNKEGKLVLAELAFKTGDVEAAVDALVALLSADPKHIQARMLMAALRVQQQRPDLAEEEYRIIYAEHPDSAGIAMPLAGALLKQGKIGESRAVLRKVLARDPKDTSAYLMLTDSFLREGKTDSARIILGNWESADPAVALPVALRKARLFCLLQQYDSAMAALSAFAGLEKENAPALGEIAKVRAKKGSLDSAAALYGTLKDLKFMPAAQSDLLVALLHLADHQPARGLEALKRLQVAGRIPSLSVFELATLVAMDQPQKAEALIASSADSVKPALRAFFADLKPDLDYIGGWALTNYFQNVSEPAWVFRVTDSLHRRWPDNPTLARSYSQHLAQIQQYGRAHAALAGIREPSVVDRMQMVDLRVKSGEFQPALRQARSLSAEHPGLKGINVVMAELNRALGNRPAMLEHYGKELALDSGNLIAVNNLAWEYGVVEKDFARAEPYLRKLEASGNSDPRILDTIGWILALNGKVAESVRYFDLALVLLPDNPSILYHKGWTLIKQGQAEEGRAMIRKALANPWNFSDKAEAQRFLAEPA